MENREVVLYLLNVTQYLSYFSFLIPDPDQTMQTTMHMYTGLKLAVPSGSFLVMFNINRYPVYGNVT